MKPHTFAHGSEWVRVDLHLHTNADKEFKYDGEPNSFSNDYIEALQGASIRLGVVTNHNKFDLGEFTALRKKARKSSIGLLPGVELSVNDGSNGIHLLVVFSEQWIEKGNDYINPFLTVAFEGKTPNEYENENGRSSLGLLDTIKKLEGYDRDFFVVFAHVEQNSGLWQEMDGGRIGELGKSEAFRRRTMGFQKVRTHDGAGRDVACRTKVKEWLDGWYPAEVEGCDPKSISEIGKGKASYMKLGELSFDALKFALSDKNNRVTTQVPERSASFIKSVSFEGGALDGKTLHLSPELNTLIGIRGSGKSSILEAIRYALDIELPHGIEAPDVAYKEALIGHTLGSGGKVSLTVIDPYGEEFVVSRIYKEEPNVYLDGKLQPGISIRETIVQRPIYFGQKDLASRGVGFEANLVEKLAGEKLVEVRSKIKLQKEKVSDAVDRLMRLQTTAEQKKETEEQLADAKFRLKKYEEHGVAEKLKRKSEFKKDAQAIQDAEEQIQEFEEALGEVLDDYDEELNAFQNYQSKENADFFKDYLESYKGVLGQFEKIKTDLAGITAIREELKRKKAVFEGTYQGLRDDFAEVERQLTEALKDKGAVNITPSDFMEQQDRQEKASKKLIELRKLEGQQTSLRDSLLEELDLLNTLWLEEFNMIKAELDRVNKSGTALQIEAGFKEDREALVAFMKDQFAGSSIREATLRNATNGYADFAAIYRDFENVKSNGGSSPETFEKYFFRGLSDFLTWQVPNLFTISYHGKELKNHSLGQRASALILFVLSQRENHVMLIDQPEDDLDNQTIYDDVIKLICTMKPDTQFIFATHNPNFPVLGDAEQIHACTYQGDDIHTICGSIDAKSIQQSIIDIMEGGEEAFDRRKEVYNMWKPR